MEFSNTTKLNGLVQLYEREIGKDYGFISGNNQRLREFTASANLARRRYFSLAVQASGTWELDDNLYGDYAVVYLRIISGQRDYAINLDEDGNVILDIYKALVLPTATSTTYQELDPVDENQTENLSLIDEHNSTGTPTRYAKRSNAIHLDAIPNYTVSRGIKLLVNREPSYYDYDDTDTKPGFPYYPEYFYLRPAYEHARRNTLDRLEGLEKEMIRLEGVPERGIVGLIQTAYGSRKKDEIDSFSGEIINSV